jgi:hypothetical protein
MIKTGVRFSLLCSFLLISLVCFGQEPARKQVKPVKAGATVPAKAKPKLTEEQKLALQLLESSEASARGLEAPMRSYSLLQIASTFITRDDKKARSLLHDAFTASLEIQDDDDTKGRLQEDIFRALLPLSLDDVQELLPQTEPKVRKQTSERIIGLYTEKKQFEKAIDLANQVTSWDEFPYDSGGRLMNKLPPDMMAEKQGLFTQAVNSYKNHEHKGMQIGGGSLTSMVVRHAAIMPPQLVMQAIDEILSQAKSNDEHNHISLGGDGGSASFNSSYEYQLFALLPVLRKLDESRAKELLEENQSVKALAQQFPEGLQSISPPQKEDEKADKNAPPRGMQTMVTIGNGGPSAAQDFATQEAQRRMREIIEEGAKDPTHAIAHAATLPLRLAPLDRISPRGQALAGIARFNVKKNPGAADQALGELLKITGDMPLRAQVQYVAGAADLYFQMGEKDNAEKAVSAGFKAADALLDKDLNPDDPNKALKAWWPSADAYRRFIEVEAKISTRGTMNILKEIKDPDVRTVESIMFAQSLFGIPMKRTVVMEKTKKGNWFSIQDTD